MPITLPGRKPLSFRAKHEEGSTTMGVMKRMSGILQAKTNKLLDKAEDPRESLDLSYQKQLESLQKVRRSVADVTTAKKRIELQATQLQQQADKLQLQAKAALTQGNEDLAREALARREALQGQLDELGSQTQLDKASTTSAVDTQLAALKAEVGAGSAPAELGPVGHEESPS